MSLVIAEHVTLAFGTLEVLRNVSFRLGESDRVGLVGPNGEGKTTLLRIIGGRLEPTSGQVHRSSGLRIGYLPQDPPTPAGETIFDAMLEVFADLRQMEQDIHTMAGQLGDRDQPDEKLLERYGQLQTQFEDLGGYEYHTRIEQVLTGLGFARGMWDQPLGQLSGGQRTRAYLATLLLGEPDVLMLDEPTNHLDLDSVEWLEGWLRSYRKALVVVSHDRYFLDSVTTATWEIDHGSLETYRGAYHEYLPKRTERLTQRQSQWQAQQEYIAKTQEFIARHIAGQRTKEAQGRRTRLERFMRDEAIPRPPEQATIGLSLAARKRTGDIVLQAGDLAVGYAAGQPLVVAPRLEVLRGQRIAIVGANGIGKTTLLRTLLGQLDLLGGEVRLGANVEAGYLSQTHAELESGTAVLDAIMAGGLCKEQQARNVLGSLLLRGDDVYKPIEQISGGQRSRVILARLMVQNANLLMLDEPTNHLDIPSTEILQKALGEFEGSVIFVSHDRYLIQAVATDVWIISGDPAAERGNVLQLAGGWEAYLQWRNEKTARPATAGSNAVPGEKTAEQRKTDYRQSRKQANLLQRLKRRHEELEVEIQQAEEQLAALNDAISAAGEVGDMKKIEHLGLEYQQKDTHLKTLWDEWEHVGGELE
ncbi:MAG: ABC-F family ATP-binding cassette domain-containing protein [Phycisphaerae bacterium]|nr:ABC-F family ATP-binding cassette domain-containing protein [Phycisphaerae bacterium]